MIAEIVAQINDGISMRALEKGITMRLFGLAEPIVRRSGNEDEVFPAIVLADGECSEVFVDDDYGAGAYHRLLGKSYQTLRMGFGDGSIEQITADMALICWGMRKITGSAQTMEDMLYAALPQGVSPMQTIFNRREVFASEFAGIPFFLNEDVILLCMKYRINATKNRKCADK
jgi:hypothetical protein